MSWHESNLLKQADMLTNLYCYEYSIISYECCIARSLNLNLDVSIQSMTPPRVIESLLKI